MLTRCPHDANTMHPNIEIIAFGLQADWLRGYMLACQVCGPGSMPAMVSSHPNPPVRQTNKKKIFFLHDVITMPTRCQQYVHLIYSCLSAVCYHDAYKMSTRWTFYLYFYIHVSLHDATTMLPRCSHNVQ